MKNVTFSDFINQIALFSVQGNTAERQDKKEKTTTRQIIFLLSKIPHIRLKITLITSGRGQNYLVLKKKKKVIGMGDGPEATYKIGNATVRIHGKIDPDKLKAATVEFLKSAERQKKSKKLVEKGA